VIGTPYFYWVVGYFYAGIEADPSTSVTGTRAT
jgi:hypothetical protein